MRLIGICFFLYDYAHFDLLSFEDIVLLEIVSWFRFFIDRQLVFQSLVK